MVQFRCKRSGNVVSFSNENDIAGLRKHEGYEEIQNGLQEKREDAPPAKEVTEKRRGRPKKEK